mgnify:FL=1
MAPPGLWLATCLFSSPAGAVAMAAAGLALGAVALLMRDACDRLDPRGRVLVVTDDEAPTAACSDDRRNGSAGWGQLRPLQVGADLRCALWLLPGAAPTSALLLCGDALGEARWRGLRQQLALGSMLYVVDGPALRGWVRTVSRPTASVSG